MQGNWCGGRVSNFLASSVPSSRWSIVGIYRWVTWCLSGWKSVNSFCLNFSPSTFISKLLQWFASGLIRCFVKCRKIPDFYGFYLKQKDDPPDVLDSTPWKVQDRIWVCGSTYLTNCPVQQHFRVPTWPELRRASPPVSAPPAQTFQRFIKRFCFFVRYHHHNKRSTAGFQYDTSSSASA